MQVLTVPLRILLFCFNFFSSKLARIKSSFASFLKYKVQDAPPSVMNTDLLMQSYFTSNVFRLPVAPW